MTTTEVSSLKTFSSVCPLLTPPTISRVSTALPSESKISTRALPRRFPQQSMRFLMLTYWMKYSDSKSTFHHGPPGSHPLVSKRLFRLPSLPFQAPVLYLYWELATAGLFNASSVITGGLVGTLTA